MVIIPSKEYLEGKADRKKYNKTTEVPASARPVSSTGEKVLGEYNNSLFERKLYLKSNDVKFWIGNSFDILCVTLSNLERS